MSESGREGLPQPGDEIAGKYEVERLLGRGGMGVVIAARHKTLGHRVAIKCLLPAFGGDAAAVARFTREAQAAVALRGEHVARVQDVGTLETGAPFMIMEFLSGTDLGARVERSGPLGVAEAVDYLLQACEAIAEAHAIGIVHRDLKPSNLFVSQAPDGRSIVKVLDFGIAKALETAAGGDAKLTATGMALGTPVYMSPEQIRDAKTVDQRTDIWALGALLHELLAGAPPFSADTLPALCAAIVADPPQPLRSSRPEVPPGLAAVIERCLRKPADERYPDVGALAQALAPFAPAESLVHVERVTRIVERGHPNERAADGPRPDDWSGTHAVAETLASGQTEASLPAAPPAKQTAAAWQTSHAHPSGLHDARRAMGGVRLWPLLAAVGLAAIIALALWLRPAGDVPAGVDPSGAGVSAEVTAEPAAPPSSTEPSTSAASGGSDPGRPDDGAEDAGAGRPVVATASPSGPSSSRSPARPSALPSSSAVSPGSKPRTPSGIHDPSILDRN